MPSDAFACFTSYPSQKELHTVLSQSERNSTPGDPRPGAAGHAFLGAAAGAAGRALDLGKVRGRDASPESPLAKPRNLPVLWFSHVQDGDNESYSL